MISVCLTSRPTGGGKQGRVHGGDAKEDQRARGLCVQGSKPYYALSIAHGSLFFLLYVYYQGAIKSGRQAQAILCRAGGQHQGIKF